jgi:DNA polymerase-1
VSLRVGPNQACYIPLGHRGGDMFAETPQMIDREAALARLAAGKRCGAEGGAERQI